METVVCPSCGNEIRIRFFTPKEITCKKCQKHFIAEYEDENGELHPGGIEGFKAIHPKITKAATTASEVGILVLTATGIVMLIKDKFDAATGASEIPSSQNSDASDQIQPQETVDDIPTLDAPSEYETKTIPVSGAVVNLPFGRHPSREKREQAAENGYYNLGENQTWRVNHDRNIKVHPKEDE